MCSVVFQTGEKSRDDALEAIKGNLDGFSRDAKMHPTPAALPKKPGWSLSSSGTKLLCFKCSAGGTRSKEDFYVAPQKRVGELFGK